MTGMGEAMGGAASLRPPLQIAVDVGGTFTDVVVRDATGSIVVGKVPSTGDDQSRGFIAGIDALIGSDAFIDVGEVVHGTTVGTNAVLERRGARSALVTTAGFTDVLELRNQERLEVWNLAYRPSEPLIPRERVIGLAERLDPDGKPITTPGVEDLEAVLDAIDALDVESVAVCLLHSYRNGAHEQLLAEALRRRWPDRYVVVSSGLVPRFREYDRASTTAMSAYIGPVLDRYFTRLRQGLAERNVRAEPLIMHSNGGVLPASESAQHAVGTVVSGPAGGVAATAALGARLGLDALIAFDMGGTSTDVCVIVDAEPTVASRSVVGGLPVIVPMYKINTVGAGGGSLASVDIAGLLRVGPESAGSVPGPASYGHGGDQPAVTDALCAMGILRAGRRYGGSITLDRDRALEALTPHATRIGVDPLALADMVVQVTTNTMAEAVREVTLREGHDPRDFTLVAFGGSGPVTGALVAEELDISRVVVPPNPGVFSALGLLATDLRRDQVFTVLAQLSDLDDAALTAEIADCTTRALEPWGQTRDDVRVVIEADLRYAGQAHEVTVTVSEPMTADVEQAFHEAHEQRYGFADHSEPVELVNLRVTSALPRSKLATLGDPAPASQAPPPRMPIYAERSEQSCRFLARPDVTAEPVEGPCVIEEETSTTYVPPGWTARTDALSVLLLERKVT